MLLRRREDFEVGGRLFWFLDIGCWVAGDESVGAMGAVEDCGDEAEVSELGVGGDGEGVHPRFDIGGCEFVDRATADVVGFDVDAGDGFIERPGGGGHGVGLDLLCVGAFDRCAGVLCEGGGALTPSPSPSEGRGGLEFVTKRLESLLFRAARRACDSLVVDRCAIAELAGGEGFQRALVVGPPALPLLLVALR